MAQFFWTDDLYTGIGSIDGGHRKLMDLANAFFETMENGQDNGRMRHAMNDLIAYTKQHFAHEEEEMARVEYVAALAHKCEHAKLLNQLVELKAMLDANGKINVPAVSDFLSEWLREHILAADMKLAAALKQGRSEPAIAQLH